MRSKQLQAILTLAMRTITVLAVLVALLPAYVVPTPALASSIPVDVQVLAQTGETPGGLAVVATSASGTKTIANTDDTGIARFTGLDSPETYEFSIQDPAGKWVQLGTAPSLPLAPGSPKMLVTLAVQPIRISGRVATEDGSTPVGSTVYLPGATVTITRADGTFAVDFQPYTGGYTYNVYASPYYTRTDLGNSNRVPITLTVCATGTTPAGPIDVGTLTLPTLKKFIVGTVQRADGGPVGTFNATATQVFPDFEYHSTYVYSPTTVFTVPVKPGRYEVNVFAGAGQSWFSRVLTTTFASTNVTETHQLTFTVSGPQITGRVVDPDGNPIQYPSLSWQSSPSFLSTSTRTGYGVGITGTFETGALAPGAYTVTAQAFYNSGFLNSLPAGPIVVSGEGFGNRIITGPVLPTGTIVSGPPPHDLGILQLRRPIKFIRGTIVRTDGRPVVIDPAYLPSVSASRVYTGTGPSTYESYNGIGNVISPTYSFTIGVRNGTWNVDAYPGYSPMGDTWFSPPAQNVSFADDNVTETRYVTFTVSGEQLIGHMRPIGQSVDRCGQVSDIFNYSATLRTPDKRTVFYGNVISDTFKFGSIPPGNYQLLLTPFGSFASGLLPTRPISVAINLPPGCAVTVQTSLAANTCNATITAPVFPTRTVVTQHAPLDIGTLAFERAVKFIRGTVIRTDGGPVSFAYAQAFPGASIVGSDEYFSAFASGIGPTATFTMPVRGGPWNVTISPSSSPGFSGNWTYNGPPQNVVFGTNDITETRYVTFPVTASPHQVRANVRLPDGTIPPNHTVFINLSDRSQGFGQTQSVSSGIFSMQVPTGTFTVDIFSNDPTIGPPVGGIPAFPMPPPGWTYVGAAATGGYTHTLGVNGIVTLTRRTASISGKVADGSGNGVPEINTSAWNRATGERSFGTTDANGRYTLTVAGGTYDVDAFPSPSQQWSREGGVQIVTVAPGSNKPDVNFTLARASATVIVEAYDPTSGNLATDAQGFVTARKRWSTSGMSVTVAADPMFDPGATIGNGRPLDSGRAVLNLPVSTDVIIAVGFPPGSSYFYTEAKDPITATANTTQTVKITLNKADAIISGALKTKDGTVVTGVRAHVVAGSASGGSTADVDPATGQYSVTVKSGQKIYMGLFIDPGQSYRWVPSTVPEVNVPSGTTSATYDFELVRADGKVNATVTDPSGNPVAGAFVGVSLPPRIPYGPPIFVGGAPTGPDGKASINVEGGKTYEVRVGAPPSMGFVNPPMKTCTVPAGASCDVSLQFLSTNSTLSGKVSFAAGMTQTLAGPAFVRAFSEKGGGVFTRTDSAGNYVLNISNGGAEGDKWHVTAVYGTDTQFAASADVVVPVTTTVTTYSQDLTLGALQNIPRGLNETFDAGELKIINLSNGVRVTIPAGALGGAGTQVTVRAIPNPSLPVHRIARPLDIGYTLEAIDSTGAKITKFNSNVTIEIPYDESKIPTGLTEDDLVPMYYDESTGTWQKADNVTIDKVNNKAILVTDHFTDFAVMSAGAVSFSIYIPVVLDALETTGW